MAFFYQHKAWSQSEFVSNFQLFVDDDISPARETQECQDKSQNYFNGI